MSNTSILIADDDQVVLTMISTVLQDAGYNVTEATNGPDAVELGFEVKPDLAVLDICMPGMDGIEVARELREQAGVYTFFLTAHDDQQFLEQAVGEGALGYLVKPIDLRQIIPAIETAKERALELQQLEKSKDALSNSLKNNQSINTAIGIYMERYGVSENSALEALRAFSRSERRKLLDVSKELVRATDRCNHLAEKIHRGGNAGPDRERVTVRKRPAGKS